MYPTHRIPVRLARSHRTDCQEAADYASCPPAVSSNRALLIVAVVLLMAFAALVGFCTGVCQNQADLDRARDVLAAFGR